MLQKINIFLSYARKDEALLDILMEHLSALKNEDLINVWYDQDIQAGMEWQQAVDTYLANAHLILLLISPAFISSKHSYGREMRQAVQRHEVGNARVIPIILRPVDWQKSPFSKLQSLPKDAKPVTSWTNQDEAFLTVAQEIRKVVEELVLKKDLTTFVESVETRNTVPNLITYKRPDIPLFKVGQEIEGIVMPLTQELRQVVPSNTNACLRYLPRSIQDLLIVVNSEKAREWSTGETHVCLFIEEITFGNYTILYCQDQPNNQGEYLPHATGNFRLTRARQERGLSIEKLAENFDVQRNIIKGWEDGTIIPSNYFIKRLRVFFDKSTKELGFNDYYIHEYGDNDNDNEYECNSDCP